MALINFVTFVVLKILDNLFSIQNSLKSVDISQISKTAQGDLIFGLNVLSECGIDFS